MCALYVTAETN